MEDCPQSGAMHGNAWHSLPVDRILLNMAHSRYSCRSLPNINEPSIGSQVKDVLAPFLRVADATLHLAIGGTDANADAAAFRKEGGMMNTLTLQ
jgi:hypothetical protein